MVDLKQIHEFVNWLWQKIKNCPYPTVEGYWQAWMKELDDKYEEVRQKDPDAAAWMLFVTQSTFDYIAKKNKETGE